MYSPNGIDEALLMNRMLPAPNDSSAASLQYWSLDRGQDQKSSLGPLCLSHGGQHHWLGLVFSHVSCLKKAVVFLVGANGFHIVLLSHFKTRKTRVEVSQPWSWKTGWEEEDSFLSSSHIGWPFGLNSGRQLEVAELNCLQDSALLIEWFGCRKRGENEMLGRN